MGATIAEFVEVVVMVLGTCKFRMAPRMGEVVTPNDEKGIYQAYRVLSLVHPLEALDTAGDLILEYIGTDLDFRMSL